MNVPFQDLSRIHNPLIDDFNSVFLDHLRRNDFIGGKSVDQFRSSFAELVQVSHCIPCANGTDAIYIALKSLGLGPGDEVITTAHTWISSAETISQCGAVPVFCDISADTFCLDPTQLESCITSRTVGILPVHLYGHPCDMDVIMQIATKYSLWVVEDCAQAHLSVYKNRTVGSFGDIATYSFYPGKNLGAFGDAGAITTNNTELASWCELFACHGGKGQHLIEGINSRLDSIQASVLNLKMPYLKEWTQSRIDSAQIYNRLLASLSTVKTPYVAPDCVHVYHAYTILCDHRDDLIKFLSNKSISTKINYPTSLPFLPAYKRFKYDPSSYPVSLRHQSKILSLPMFVGITPSEQTYIVDCIASFHQSL